MPNDLLAELKRRVLVCEGAMGSMLTAKGIAYRNSAEVNLSHPEAVVDIHRAYREAGAEVFQTNTFAANLRMLQRAGLADQAVQIQVQAVRLCREAVGPEAFVAAGGGPVGDLLKPLGDLEYADVVAIFRQQFEVMLAQPVDFVLLETFESAEELKAAVEGVRQAGCRLPIATTVSFSNPNGRNMMGQDGATMARAMMDMGVDIIGANCGHPQGLLIAMRQMAEITELPLMAQANAGVPQLVGGRTVYTGTPEQSGKLAAELVQLGVRIVGGCCGTTPEHIRQIARAAHASP